MEYPLYTYAVIGGDMRQVYLTEELAHHNNQVCHYALAATPNPHNSPDNSDIHPAKSLKDACMHSQCIVCPIPLSKNGYDLNQNGQQKNLSLALLLSLLEPEHHLFAGCIPDPFEQAAKKKGVHTHDLMEDTPLTIYNTIATAEGALCEAISKSSRNLNHSRCAVLGFGKCGRTLTQYLTGMFCDIRVYSDQTEECAQASIIVPKTGCLFDFSKCAKDFDFIFNTIPALVISAETLSNMNSSVTIIDIASSPGGVDYEEAEKMGISATLCLGLPGKYAPLSSAKAIKTAIESKRSECNCL